MPTVQLMTPQDELVSRYRQPRRTWSGNRGVRQAAHLLGMNEREYCDRYVERLGPIYWTGTTTTVQPLDAEAAYAEAVW